ncbi:MAG: hypothetical protein HKN46_07600 [Acidimicrobiia bacterium]|nr:hypothetical protein [Acidimicrobiia bacterium]
MTDVFRTTAVVDAAAHVVDDAVVSRARRLLGEAERRTALPPNAPVVALVGGTGSGKSSVLNALAGVEVAQTGLIRPTTESPLAWVPAALDGGTSALLDGLGVLERVDVPPAPGWAVLDLPDTDSVLEGHGLIAEWIIPRADVVVWVTDPIKYHDARTAGMLSRLRPDLRGVVIALNKVDTVAPEHVADVHAALTEFAEGLGWAGRVVPMASAPPTGPPIGTDALRRAIEGAVAEAAFDPVDHLCATAVELIRAATPASVFDLRPWQEVEEQVVGAVTDLLAPAEARVSLRALGRATAATGAGGASGGILHRVLHGPAAVVRDTSMEALERDLGDWRSDERTVATRSSLELLLLDVAAVGGEAPSEVGGALDAAWEDAVSGASDSLVVEERPWWWFTRIAGWLAPLALLVGVVMAIAGIAGGVVIAITGAIVSVVVGVLALGTGGAAADAAWDGFRTEVEARARAGLAAAVGRSYRRAVAPAFGLADALAASPPHPYT